MRHRLALGIVTGLTVGFALNSWLLPRPALAQPQSSTASLIHGVPYVDRSLVPSTLLHLLALHQDDENRLLSPTLVTALELNAQEVSATTAYLRKMADNWTYVVRVRSTDDSKWALTFPEQDARHYLSDIARWAEQTLGPRRGYLFMVMMEQDFRILFLRDDVTLEKNSEFEWSLISNQHGHSFDLRKLQPASPMLRLKAKCEAK